MKYANYDKGYVYCVRGKPYFANYPVQCFWAMIWLPLGFHLVDGNWWHLGGITMIIVGLMSANPRFSPVHGCLVWLLMIGVAIYESSHPRMAIPLIAWGAVAWIAGCIECRLTLVPYVNAGEPAKIGETESLNTERGKLD